MGKIHKPYTWNIPFPQFHAYMAHQAVPVCFSRVYLVLVKSQRTVKNIEDSELLLSTTNNNILMKLSKAKNGKMKACI